jgi:hypothetical protein
MYIEMSTADANPVSGPISYLHGIAQQILCKTMASSTYRYAGGMAQIKLKNRMTRHKSRRPSPKDTGPSVPAENLRIKIKPSLIVSLTDAIKGKCGHTHDSIFVFADSHMKNILMKCVSVLSSTATGWIPVR